MDRVESDDMKGMDTETVDKDMSLILDLSIPQKTIQIHNDEKAKQVQHPILNLFFSFDIVNSTKYKLMTNKWQYVMTNLLDALRRKIEEVFNGEAFLWRTLGDEFIFVLPITSISILENVTDDIYNTMHVINESLASGAFFQSIPEQILKDDDIKELKSQDILSIKSAAWIAIVSSELEYPHYNFYYDIPNDGGFIREYLGADIDLGFRLKNYAHRGILVISFELAILLEKSAESMHIMSYKRLKGVWNEELYPIIWYYNREISKKRDFEDFFKYSEVVDSEIIKEYFSRKNNCYYGEAYYFDEKMYQVNYALNKILNDRLLPDKIRSIKECIENSRPKKNRNHRTMPLELHFAAVCCNVKERKVLILKRSEERSINPEKWEFGCAVINSSDRVVEAIENYYRMYFNAEIEVVVDKTREDVQPIPLAIYEINENDNIKKGIICVAKLLHFDKLRKDRKHEEMKLISIDLEMDEREICEDDAIPDFYNTIEKIKVRFDELFDKEKKDEHKNR